LGTQKTIPRSPHIKAKLGTPDLLSLHTRAFYYTRLIKDKRNEQRICGRKDTLTINRSAPPISPTHLDDRFGKPTENQLLKTKYSGFQKKCKAPWGQESKTFGFEAIPQGIALYQR